MRLLALETATEGCSVALWLDGELLERFEVAPRGHAERVLPWAEALLAEAGLAVRALDAVAFGRGPGAFTGLRIACGVAQGIALGAGLPVVPVSTLAALAQGAAGPARPRILAALDARMGEVYWGGYVLGEEGLVRPAGEEALLPPERVPRPQGEAWWGAGPGWAAHGEALRRRLGGQLAGASPELLPRAGAVARLAAAALARGEALPPEQAQPAYLRQQVATPPR